MPRKKKLTKQQKRKKQLRLVVKANQLVEAKYMFDIWEMRFFLSIVSAITPSDEENKVYRVWYRDIKKNFQVRSNSSYDALRKAADRFFEKTVVIGYMKDGYERETKYHIIQGLDYLKAGQGEGAASQEYIDFRIDPAIRPYLLDFRKRFDPTQDRYTSYELRNVINLQTYGIRIYELLKQYEKIGHRTLEVSTLKDCFNITDEYPRFTNFYQMVIKRSIKDINSKTDITIPIAEIEKIKKGRKVHALRFPIRSKTQKELAIIRGEAVQQTLFDEVEVKETEMTEEVNQVDVLFSEFEPIVVKSFGVTPSTFFKLLNTGKYKKADIEQAISVTRRAKYNQEIKKSVAGFFLHALKEGYTDVKEEAKKSKQQKVQHQEVLEAQLSALKDDLAKQINDKIKQLTATDETVTLEAIDTIKSNRLTEALVRAKEKSIGRPLQLEDYRQDERLRTMVINTIIQIRRGQFEDILKIFNPKIKAIEQQIAAL